MASTRVYVIEAVVLVALAIVTQILTGVLGQASYTAGNQICNGNFQSTNAGCVNYVTSGQSTTTVLNFLTVIFLIAAVGILLKILGMGNILKVGTGRNE